MKACRQLRDLDTAMALLEHHLNFQRPELICINAFLSVCSEVRLAPPPRSLPPGERRARSLSFVRPSACEPSVCTRELLSADHEQHERETAT
jgi:hypothetical protein